LPVEVETDGTLIERSVRGRPDAFVEVVRRHEVAVHAFLARRAGPGVAADLLGEVWLRAFAGRGGYDLAYADARPWLFGIARNVLRSHWRASHPAGHPAPTGYPAGTGYPLGTGYPAAEDPWDDVIDRLDGPVRSRALLSAIRALPQAERDVLLLVAWEQLTPAQAAAALGVPQGTARSRLHRARAALRLALAAHPAEEES
jgi:RNA polymerase sigma factor (sigma-70 family)